jgi:arylsulfatase A-like enzyme
VSPDVAPTILDLCGLTPPPRMQGRSLTPLMRDANAPWREDFFCESHILFQSYPITQGVRSQRWKYIRYWPLRPVPKDYREILNLGLNGEPLAYEELYDLRNDPHEQVNLAGAAEHRAIIERLRTRCVELQRESLGRQPGDPLPSDSMADWRKATETFDRALKNDPGM